MISVITYFVALVPFAFNGLGITEGSMTYLLTLNGANLQQSIASAVLLRFVTLSVSLIGGVMLILGPKLRLFSSNKNDEKTIKL